MLALLALLGSALAGPDVYVNGEATGLSGNFLTQKAIPEGAGAGGVDFLLRWPGYTDLIAKGGLTKQVTESTDPLRYATIVANQSAENSNATFAVRSLFGRDYNTVRFGLMPALNLSMMKWQTRTRSGPVNMLSLDVPLAVNVHPELGMNSLTIRLEAGPTVRLVQSVDDQVIPSALDIAAPRNGLGVYGLDGRFTFMVNDVKVFFDVGAMANSADVTIPGISTFHVNAGTNAVAKLLQLN